MCNKFFQNVSDDIWSLSHKYMDLKISLVMVFEIRFNKVPNGMIFKVARDIADFEFFIRFAVLA